MSVETTAELLEALDRRREAHRAAKAAYRAAQATANGLAEARDDAVARLAEVQRELRRRLGAAELGVVARYLVRFEGLASAVEAWCDLVEPA